VNNKIDHRSIVAVVLCVAFYLIYTQYLNSKYPRPAPSSTAGIQSSSTTSSTVASSSATSPAANATTPAPASGSGSAAAAATQVVALSPSELRLETDKVIYQFSQELGGFASIQLKDFNQTDKADAGLANLIDSPMALQGTTEPRNPDPVSGVFHAERQGQSLTFWRESGGFKISQTYSVPSQGYGLDLKVSFTNTGSQPAELTSGILLTETLRAKKSAALLGIIPGTVRERDQLIYHADDNTEWIDVEKFCDGDADAPRLDGVPVGYVGIDRHYFLTVFQPKAKTGSLRLDHGAGSGKTGCSLSAINYDRQGSVQPGETVNLDYRVYAGPKDLNILHAQDPGLTSAMHLGTFGFIAEPLLMVIEAFQRVTRNYGVAIILLTICLKLLFYPLVRASTISMHKMKKLNPQMNALKERFKDDRARQQQELMKFMAANKINPMKGCLPVLPTIPVFFAFYQVLQTSISLRHAPFGLWIHDLSAMDPYFVTPVLMGAAMVVQQKLTPTTGMDKTQEKILMLMPIMFTVMMLSLPAGLTLYMLTNTVIGIAQQKWLYHRLDKLEPATR
jgi:YidC/Oxa1 family membrane protein insertase